MQKPRRKQVRDETMKLLTENGLTGWKVRFNPRLTRALGRCIASQKTIEYQPKFMELNDWDEVVMTIRHEVAHAISPRWEGHGAIWRANCIKLGGNGKQYNTTATIHYKFTGTCHGCGKEVKRNKRSNSSCARCSGGRYNPDYALVWTRND
jgi:predicted SprT family Zn-dependent metalloprotease